MDFIEEYLAYVRETESPYTFHRWCCLVTIGALLGRNVHIQFGHGRIFPNLYCMLVGEAGTRKSSAVKIIKGLITAAGYDTIAADKTSKEKFLLDLEGVDLSDFGGEGDKRTGSYDSVTSDNLWNGTDLREIKEVYIVADEFNEFAGAGNIDFYTLLGNLWDWDDEERPYKFRLKNSKSVAIYQPTVSLLGGNTHENFARAFPSETQGIGFLSRLILISGEISGRKYTFPPTPTSDSRRGITDTIRRIRGGTHKGQIHINEGASGIVHKIYHSRAPISDIRFKDYNNRRLTQMLKLSIIVAIAKGKEVIDEECIITANTYLAAAEHVMPRALGEFGKSRYSDVANKLMVVLEKANRPLTAKDLWTHVHNDLEKMMTLQEIMNGLVMAGKVQSVKGLGWLPKKEIGGKQEFVDWSLVTEEERSGIMEV